MLALLAAGASLIHFIDTWWAMTAGSLLLGIGPVLFGIGVRRYRRVNRDLQRTKRREVR